MMLLPPISCPYTQDRRGHLKARKFGQCCNHISEFYSRLSQLSVCRHRDYRGLYLAAWIDLLLNENEFLLYSRQQSTAVNYYFVHWTKKASDCRQINILQNFQKKIISNKISETAIFCEISLRIRWYFSQIFVIKTFYKRNRHQSCQKSHSALIFFNFLSREHTQLPNLRQLQYVTNALWKLQTNRTNGVFVVWVRVNWGGIYISLQSNAAWSWLIFIVWR